MKHTRKLRLGAVLALVATAAITVATTASAGGQLFRELIDEEESAVEVDFCGVEGLTVEFATHTSEGCMPFHTDGTASSTSAST